MKAVILAGGRGSRISEETAVKPKPMIEIGGKPILWHIMKFYSAHGIDDFIICCGYLGYVIKEYFANYFVHTSDVTFDLINNRVEVHQKRAEPWRVTLVDTGIETMTGGRLKRVREYLGNEDFCFTYGDGLSNVNVSNLIKNHQRSGKLATVTAVQPPGRFGALILDGENIEGFREKPEDGGWINGGFFILNPKVVDYIENDDTVWEREPMENLVRDNQMNAFLHHGFFQPMDTLRDKLYLEELIEKGTAPWKIW
ncbi:MAG TPA: glucose-1-phosphate cytidylyltransferase [Pyrinomonadaceae bacterium]